MKAAIIGLGYWGPNLIRNFLANSNIEEVYGCDRDAKRLRIISQRFPQVMLNSNYNELLQKKEIDIIAIATPVGTHYELASSALNAGKHVWVEKPFTASSNEAENLIELSEKLKLNIFVDHTFIYTGAVQKIKEVIDQKVLGEIIYFDSVRINLGLFQHDVNVIWDLAPHDISILHYLVQKKPLAVCANGIANYYDHENIAHISVYFKDNCFAHFHVNWTSPVKIRRMLVGGKDKMLVFDDMENSEKIKIYDSGVKFSDSDKIHDALVQYRIGDMYAPKINQTEALSLGTVEFINSIIEGRKPLTSAVDGLYVVKILEAAEKSIKAKGKFVELN